MESADTGCPNAGERAGRSVLTQEWPPVAPCGNTARPEALSEVHCHPAWSDVGVCAFLPKVGGSIPVRLLAGECNKKILVGAKLEVIDGDRPDPGCDVEGRRFCEFVHLYVFQQLFKYAVSLGNRLKSRELSEMAPRKTENCAVKGRFAPPI